ILVVGADVDAQMTVGALLQDLTQVGDGPNRGRIGCLDIVRAELASLCCRAHERDCQQGVTRATNAPCHGWKPLRTTTVGTNASPSKSVPYRTKIMFDAVLIDGGLTDPNAAGRSSARRVAARGLCRRSRRSRRHGPCRPCRPTSRS